MGQPCRLRPFRMRVPLISPFSLVLAPLALAGCGGAQEPAPGALRPDEARAINEASEMLAADSVRAEALTPTNQMDRP